MMRSTGPRRAVRYFGAFALGAVLAVPSAGCGRGPGGAPARVVERQETIGRAPVRLRSELSPPRGTLGDRISWRLTARLGEGVEPGVLLLGEMSPAVDLDASKPPARQPERGGLTWSRSLVVRGFDLGAVPLPVARLPARFGQSRDTLEFPQDTLFVDSLTQSITGELRPDRGPIEPELRPVDYAVAASGALLLVGLLAIAAWLLTRARRRSRAPVAAVSEPPEAILERALEALRGEFDTLPRDVFYDRLSLALRSYASAVTGAPALDMTTAELERELDGRPGVRTEGRRALVSTLHRADLAKFARYEDPSSEAMTILSEAKAIAGTLVQQALPPQPKLPSSARSSAGPAAGTGG